MDESHNYNDGVKDGAEGKTDNMRCFAGKDYEKGTTRGEGIKDGTNNEVNSTWYDLDENYAKGVDEGEKTREDDEGEGFEIFENEKEFWEFLGGIFIWIMGAIILATIGTIIFAIIWFISILIGHPLPINQ
jgi:hypothetical protein